MTGPALPWLPPTLRAYLLGDTVLSDLVGGRISTRAPSDVTQPWGRIQVPGPGPRTPSAGAYAPLVQFDGWCDRTGWDGRDPEAVAWDIAARALVVLDGARNVAADGFAWSCRRVIEGPLPTRDTSRGEANPLYGAMVRAELLVHVAAVATP